MSGKSKHLGDLTYRQMEIVLRMATAPDIITITTEGPKVWIGWDFYGPKRAPTTSFAMIYALKANGLLTMFINPSRRPTYYLSKKGIRLAKEWNERLSQHWRAKFTDDQVREIRQRYEHWQKIKAEKQVTIEGLAEEFNVSASCVGTMLIGDTYKGVK